MNTPFQDTNINEQNIKLYKETPEEELTKNVNPEVQKQIIHFKKNVYKSLSPERSPKTQNNFNVFLQPYPKTSKSQASLVLNTKQNFLPSISYNESVVYQENKSRYLSQGDNFRQQSFMSQFPNSSKSEQQTMLFDRNQSMKTLFQEDKNVLDSNIKLNFLKKKYEKTIKNTLILRNKSNQARQIREISKTQQDSPEKSNMNKSTAFLQQNDGPKNLLGIFFQKKQNEAKQNSLNGQQNIKVLPSPLISTYKYDKIYKMFVEQQQKLAQQEAEKQNSNYSTQFNFNTDKPRDRKTIKKDFRLKTLGNQNEFMDSINSKRSVDSEMSNQISPIQQLSYLSVDSKQQQQQRPPQQKQKFFGNNFKSKKEYLSFLNNPLSLLGAAINTPNSEQPQQQQQQIQQQQNKKIIFSNNAIQKIFNDPNQASPQKQAFVISDKASSGSQKDTSLEEQQLNLSQELMKKSSFSINMQQNTSQIHKPFGSLTQSSFKRNPSVASEKFREQNSNQEFDDLSKHKRNYSTKVSNNFDDNQIARSRFASEDYQEEEEMGSPILNIHIALQNLNELKIDNEESVIEDGSKQLISLKKINQDENRKVKSKKQVDFDIEDDQKETIDKDYLSNNTGYTSQNDDFFNGLSLGRLKSETVDFLEQNEKGNNRKLLNQPSIALKTEDVGSGLENDHTDQNEEEEEEGQEDLHGFVLKKSIDFSQLKELRDKTINKFSPGKQVLNKQQSSNLNSMNKGGSQNKFHPIQSPQSQKNNKFNFISQKNIQPNSARNLEQESKGENKKSNLHKYFKTGKKKGKGKKDNQQEQQNEEEKQREKDLKIAEKLEDLKDNLRMQVKVAIRQQIQKKIQSNLSQQILSNVQINNDVNEVNQEINKDIFNYDDQYEQIEDIPKIMDLPSPSNTFQQQSVQQQEEQVQLQQQQQKLQKQTQSQHQSSSQQLIKSLSKAQSPKSPNDFTQKQSFHSKQSSIDKTNQKNPSLQIQLGQSNGNSKNHSVHSNSSSKNQIELTNLQSPSKQTGLSKYSSFNNNNGDQKTITPLVSPNKKIQNPSYDQQQKEVQEYSSAIMNFFNACVDNMKDNTNMISHDFQLKHLKNFNEQFSKNLVNTFTQEMKNQKMTDEEVERFKYIYEINTKMHIFYKGIVHLLGGVYKLKDLVELIIKKISSHLTLLPVNHVFSQEQMYRRIIPGICALLCDDHKLFYQTLKIFMTVNQEEFSFIDFYFIKKYIYSFLSKQKKNEISQQLCLLIMQKIESVRRYIFPINVLSDQDLRESVTKKLLQCEKFMELFCPQFKFKHVKNLINRLYDYFYNDGEDASVLDFNYIKKAVEPFANNKVSRKMFDYIESFTQRALQEDPFTLNVILRDLHYKFTKVRLRFGFKQGIFGIIKFNSIGQLMILIKEEIDNSIEYGLLAELDENEQQKVKDTAFLQKYLRFLLCEYDIFSVYDTSVSMSYLGVTQKIFKFWVNCLHTIMLTRFNLQPSKVQIFMRFIEACCPTT